MNECIELGCHAPATGIAYPGYCERHGEPVRNLEDSETPCWGCCCGAPHDCTGYCTWYCPACLADLDQRAAAVRSEWEAAFN